MFSKGAISPQPWGKWGILLVQSQIFCCFTVVTCCVCEDLLEAALFQLQHCQTAGGRSEKPLSPDKNLTLNSFSPAEVLWEIGQDHGPLLPFYRADPHSEKVKKVAEAVRNTMISGKIT